MLHREAMTNKWKYFHYFLLVIGIFAGCVSFIISAGALIKAFKDDGAETIEIDSNFANVPV